MSESDSRDPREESDSGDDAAASERRSQVNRRDLFRTASLAAVAGVGGWALGQSTSEDPLPASDDKSPQGSVVPEAERRPGITEPDVPQRHAVFVVVELPGKSDAQVASLVSEISQEVQAGDPDAGAVTVTVGVSLSRASALWPDRCNAEDLPPFTNDADQLVSGGDLAVQVCAETTAAVNSELDKVMNQLGNPEVLWSQRGYRDAPTARGTARTSAGFIDGIANPRSKTERAAGVWSDPDHLDTFLVVRRMTVSSSFSALAVPDQERAIGRRLSDGSPLSGGSPDSDIDLFAKAPDGALLIAPDAHARRAHPANIGRGLMLRRSYSFDPVEGRGLIFVAFVSDPQIFVLTQKRLDEADALLGHTTTNASGCFFVPGSVFG